MFLGVKVNWKAFFVGVGSVLSFGWAKSERYSFVYPHNAISNDYNAVGRDLHKALKKYSMERNNEKA
jgi:hypothetical protein